MRTLGFMIALVAMTASTPALASDYSTDRHFTQGRAATATVRSAEVRSATPEAKKESAPCTCSCARRTGDERPAASRVELGGH